MVVSPRMVPSESEHPFREQKRRGLWGAAAQHFRVSAILERLPLTSGSTTLGSPYFVTLRGEANMRIRMIVYLVALMAGLQTWNLLSTAQEKPAPKRPKASLSADAPAAAEKPLRLVAAAKAFLASLNDGQKATASLAYGSEQRVGWHFIPMDTRKGLPLMDMQEEQKTAAMALLRAAVSQVGYDKTTKIMQLESVLLQLEGPKSEGRRNPEKYYFTLFGEPALKQDWGLSVEGHHLSLNFSMNGNQIVDSTPQFLGANPAELKDTYGDQFKKGLRVLRDEEQLAFELVNSLDEGQLAKAMLAGEVPSEIRAAGEPQPPTDAARGIAASELTAEQLATLKSVMEAYSKKMRPSVATQRWELIEDAKLDNVHFAWSGAKKPGIGHYYVIQGPTMVIEFINVQADAAGNPANHIHCVWRDLQGDFNLPIAGK